MLVAAALLASLLAQAEQAPAPAAPAPAPGPAEAAPAPNPAAPAPAPAPVSPVGTPPAPTAQAPATPSPVAEDPPPPPVNSVSVHARYAYRVENAGTDPVPAAGFSLGGEFERRLLDFQNGLELGLATDFFYDRFAKDVIVTPVGSSEPAIATQTLSQTSFALMGTTGWRYADMRLFAGVGAGLAIGYFGGTSPFGQSGSTTDMQLLTRGVFGFDFAIAARTAAILRVDYTHLFLNDTYYVTSGAPPSGPSVHPLFGDIFNAGIGLLVRF